ncbi:hypothetical protein [Actinoplanes regularis]|uniref:Uncharacterized protein n=1 Tax=Actinoplanes regularis TaxID=52697 RepID=A0A239FSM5_9ACTN|nr:hypothetical protein [Actinoplanes regularis]GIE90146.1 hypothetical protein Are01nite_66260 [Actinoplanes regularis]SNS60066.1 hypothetical protein SAMN06264365_11939 [Actinoplanes regularis]
MRTLPLVAIALTVTALTGCTEAGPKSVTGDAGPAGSPPPVVTAIPSSPSSSPSATASTTGKPTATSTASPADGIRGTDWDNATLTNLGTYGEMRFKNGKATKGANTCTMLPGGAKPFYADYITEEPANAPSVEDALVLVECGSDAYEQMLMPAHLTSERNVWWAAGGVIKADPPPGPGKRMTFVSYRVENETIVTTVRKPDGSTQVRRYRYDNIRWERF